MNSKKLQETLTREENELQHLKEKFRGLQEEKGKLRQQIEEEEEERKREMKELKALRDGIEKENYDVQIEIGKLEGEVQKVQDRNKERARKRWNQG